MVHYSSLLEIDLTVGAILDELDRLGISENTLVYFASDHGCHIDIGNQGGSNRPFRGKTEIKSGDNHVRK